MRATPTSIARIVPIAALAVALLGCVAAPEPAAPPTASPDPTVTGSPAARTASALLTASPAAVSPTPSAPVPPTAAPATPSSTPVPTLSVQPSPTVAPAPSPAADGWGVPQRISRRAYNELAVAIGPNGEVHAVATTFGGEPHGLFYLTNSGGTWTEARLTTAPPSGADLGPSITIDSDGSVWVSSMRYARYTWCWMHCPRRARYERDGIYYLINRAGAWSEPNRWSEPDQFAANGGWLLRVRDGRIHVAHELAPHGVAYSTDASGTWTTTELAAAGWIYGMEVASDGSAHIVLYEEEDDTAEPGFQYVVLSPSGDRQSVPLDGFRPSRFALDRASNPHLVLDRDDQPGEEHVTRRNGSWTKPQTIFDVVRVDTGDGDFWDARPLLGAIAVDDEGALHAVNMDVGDGVGLVYASNRSGTFVTRQFIETVWWDDAVPPASAIAIDGHGRPHLLFGALGVRGDEEEGLWYVVGPPVGSD